MIVLEGPDGAGKTRLAQRLCFDLDVPIVPKAVNGQAEAVVDLDHWVEQSIAEGWGKRIYDRHALISELVYSPAMDKPWKAPFHHRGWVQNQLARFYALEPFIIYCLPPFEVVWENTLKDDDSVVVQNEAVMTRVYKLYEARMAVDLAISKSTTRLWDYANDEGTGWYESLCDQLRMAFRLRGF